MLHSSNPILTQDHVFGSELDEGAATVPAPAVATLSGVVNKSALLGLIALVTGGFTYTLVDSRPWILWASSFGSMMICIGMAFIFGNRPASAPIYAPIYAAVKGVFLGAFTATADRAIRDRGLDALGGAGLQAFIVTGSTLVAMLLLYSLGLVRPSRKVRAVIRTLTMAVMITYLVSFLFTIIFKRPLPFISVFSGTSASGWRGVLGLALNVGVLILAALFLVTDFQMIEKRLKGRPPRYMEWYCGFALMVTLAWIYLEALRLLMRLARISGRK